MHNRLVFLCVLLTLILPQRSANTSIPSSDHDTDPSLEVIDFVSWLYSNLFPNCSTLLVTDGSDFSHSYYVKLTPKLSSNWTSNSQTFFFINVRNSWTLKRTHSIRKHNNHCFLNVFLIETPDLITLARLSLFTNHKYGVPTWKDTDHYVVVTRNRESAKALLNSRLLMKIKYTIVIYPSAEHKFNIETSCQYCNQGHRGIIPLQRNIDLAQVESTLSLQSLFPDLEENFHNYKIRAAVSSKIQYRIEIHPDPSRPGKYVGKPGPHTRIVELCRRKLNFTYELFPSIGGGGSGVLWKNGSWTGSMADVLYDNAEFGMVTAQTLQRDELVSFSFPITYDWLTFATSIPQPRPSWKDIFRPFTSDIWIGVLLSICCLAFVFSLMGKSSFVPDAMTLTQSLWYIYASVMEQHFIFPNSSLLRILCVLWLLFALIVVTLFRSKLTASLAFPLVESPPQTFEELTNSDGYSWGLYYLAGAAFAAFKSSENPTYQQIFKRMEIEHSNVNCMLRAANSKFGCIIYEASAIDVGYRNLSDRYGRNPTVVAPATTFFITSCWVMEKRAVFRPNFHKIMHQSMDMGLNNKWVEMNYDRLKMEKARSGHFREYDSLTHAHDIQPLKVRNVVVPLWILVIGSISSLLIFVTEAVTPLRTYLRKFLHRGQLGEIILSNDTQDVDYPHHVNQLPLTLTVTSSHGSSRTDPLLEVPPTQAPKGRFQDILTKLKHFYSGEIHM